MKFRRMNGWPVLSPALPEFMLFPQFFRAFVLTDKVNWLAIPASGVADCQNFSTEKLLFEPLIGTTEAEGR